MSHWSQLWMLERYDEDGRLRITVYGELDLAVARRLTERLDQLRKANRRVRLDLSRLAFIDCSGLHAVIEGVRAGRGAGRDLIELDRQLARSARRLIELLDLEPLLLPKGRDCERISPSGSG